jgi:thioester reductase-like protein
MPRTPKKRVEYKLIEHPPWRYEDLRNRMPRPPEKMKLAEYLRWRNETLRQWRSKPPSDTERAEKLELLKRLSRNELTQVRGKLWLVRSCVSGFQRNGLLCGESLTIRKWRTLAGFSSG